MINFSFFKGKINIEAQSPTRRSFLGFFIFTALLSTDFHGIEKA